MERLNSLLFTGIKHVRLEVGMRHRREESGSVGDDELVYPPVFIAPVGQVAPNDDGDLSGPVAGRRHKDMRAGGQAMCGTQGSEVLGASAWDHERTLEERNYRNP